MTAWRRALVLVVSALLGACESNPSPTCSLAGGTHLASAPWPKFRADTANTGRAPNVDLTASAGNAMLLFDRHCSFTTSQACRTDADCPVDEICLVPRHCSRNRAIACTSSTDCQCGSDPTCQPGQTCVAPIGAVVTTPIVGIATPIEGESSILNSIYVASADGNVYVLNPPKHCSGTNAQLCDIDADCPEDQTCEDNLQDTIQVVGAIVGTPLLGANGTLFVPSSGLLSQFDADGTVRNVGQIPGLLSASPNIWNGKFCSETSTQACDDDTDCPSGETCAGSVDGTVYLASPAGFFTGMCPNGIARFGVIFPGTQSSAAIVPDPNFVQPMPIIIVGGFGGQVRAYNVRGRQYWSFFTSATVVNAVLVDQTTDLFYVADTGGRVFAGDMTNGQRDPDFSFVPSQLNPPLPAPATITASPALGRDRLCRGGPDDGESCATAEDCPDGACLGGKLYIAGQSVVGQTGANQRGVLYALDRATGRVCWTFEADGPISSSPAVATGGPHDVIVFAADVLDDRPGAEPVASGGRVYAVPDRDDDLCDGLPRCGIGEEDCPLWVFDPASIDPPGHSYSIGSSSPAIGPDGTVYIGRTGNRRGAGTECPGSTPCVVNDGGALYAIKAVATP